MPFITGSDKSSALPRKHVHGVILAQFSPSRHGNVGESESESESEILVNEIRVSAVVMCDEHGNVLTVRKAGTEVFMLPGGKPEPEETAAETALREFWEELGVQLDAAKLKFLGEFHAPAANEADFTVVADTFTHPFVSGVQANAEIAELAWVDPAVAHERMAPLNNDLIFPLLLAHHEHRPNRLTQHGCA